MNPLYDALNGAVFGQSRPVAGGMVNASMNQNALLGQLQANPTGVLRNAGYNVPEELSGNPQAMVQHLIQTGQIGGPMLQRVMPMMQGMMGK